MLSSVARVPELAAGREMVEWVPLFLKVGPTYAVVLRWLLEQHTEVRLSLLWPPPLSGGTAHRGVRAAPILCLPARQGLEGKAR